MAESEQGHRIRVGLFDKNVEEVFSQALKKILPLLRGVTVPEGEAFRWETHPQLAKALQEATKELKSDLKELFKKAVEQEYNRGLQNKISAQNEAFGPRVMRTLMAQQRVLMEQRGRAVNSYLQRVNTGNFSLARRIWKIGEQARADMATAIKAGLEDGLDYRQLARNVKEFLIEPNRLYRRVRGKDGMLHLSKAAKEYHPGQGVYRSSVRNAQRVARTETNIAYRRGELDSAQGDPFVLGIRVNLSANHTTKLPNGKTVHFFDICDELSNQNYPKDFKFTGWHPHCRCYITYIMVPQAEAMEMIRRGLRVPPYSKPITDTPEAFKEWLVENRSRLEKSTNLPYFIRENQKYISGIKYTPEGLAQIQAAGQMMQKTEPTTLEKAEQRHAARTPEQIAEIQKKWHDRQMWRKHAQGVLRATDGVLDFGEERVNVANFLEVGRYEEASKLATYLRDKIKKELKYLEMLDVRLADLKKYELLDLGSVRAAVKSKLDSFSKYDLDKQKQKLKFEIDWVEKNKKYSTWEIAQRAYKKELAAVDQKIELQEVGEKMSAIQDYVLAHPKSKKVADLFAAAEKALADGDSMTSVKAKIKEAENVIKINEQTKAYLAAKRGGMDSLASDTLEAHKKAEKTKLEQELADIKAKLQNKSKLTAAEIQRLTERREELTKNMDFEVLRKYFDEYEKGRADANDKLLRPVTKKVWKNLTQDEKVVVTKYTQTYNYLNEPLRGKTYSGRSTGTREFNEDLPKLTSALDKFSMPKDIVVRRGTNNFEISSIGKYLSTLEAGDVWVDKGFLSTAAGKGYGLFQRYDLIIVIPKGAKGIYAEPFSHFTDSMKYNYAYKNLWGGQTDEDMGSEREWIGQRGSKFKVLKVEGSTIYMELIGQKNKTYG